MSAAESEAVEAPTRYFLTGLARATLTPAGGGAPVEREAVGYEEP